MKTKSDTTESLSFTQACAYLGITPAELAIVREQGLTACLNNEGHQIYPADKLEITRGLLMVGSERGWNTATLAWYADLLFASQIGRAILLPIHEQHMLTTLRPANWLATPYSVAVLASLVSGVEKADAAITSLLKSLVAVGVGSEQFWSDANSLEQSALYPVIAHFEDNGTAITDPNANIARDALNNYALIVLAFGRIALPISREFSALVQIAQDKLKNVSDLSLSTSPAEQALILQEPLVPVDKIYASKATEIHTSSQDEAWDFKFGVLRTERRTIAVQMKLPLEADQPFIDNIIDMIRPFLGTFGARVVQLLYEIANDPPYFRNPVVTIDTNQVLDRLGLKRDSRGIHRSKNRERLRDALNAAHALEIVGEYTTWEGKKQVRKTFYRPVLSILGATFDAEENAGLSTVDLRTRGLPKSLQVRLNFYDGIRRPDGKLGNQYVLVPRLAEPQKLPKANYAATADLLKAYFFFRYRQTQMKSRTLVVTRETALEKAHITNKHASRATATLRKALDNLVSDGTLQGYTTPLPAKPRDTFEATLSEQSTYNMESE